MVSSLEQVDGADLFGDAVLVVVDGLPVRLGVHEVGSQERSLSMRGDLHAPAHEVRVARPARLVVLEVVEGDHLQVGAAQRDVRVEAVRALDEGRTIAVDRPVRGFDQLIVDVLVVPQAVLVGDPRVGVLGAEDGPRAVLADDVVGVGDVVGVRVGAQVESDVSVVDPWSSR